MIRCTLIFSLLVLLVPAAHADGESPQGVIEVHVHGLRSLEGGVAAAIFDDTDPKAFPVRGEQALVSLYESIEDEKVVVFRFEGLRRGNYALSFFHDENGNRTLDTNFLGIPREGMGASNDAVRRFGPPRFEDAAVTLDDERLQIKVQMHY